VQQNVQPVAAFEVSKRKRICRFLSLHPTLCYEVPSPIVGADCLSPVQIVIAVLSCLFATGIVFGYAALKPILIREHVYEELCTNGDLKSDVPCYDQEVRLNLMFTVAAVATNVVALPVGAMLDKFGPFICSIIGTFFLAAGASLFAFAQQLPFDGYLFGYLFLGLGGPFIYIPSFQLSNAFPKHSGLILALLTGAFDAASALFMVYRLVYLSTSHGILPKDFFLAYLIVPALILVAQICIMPRVSYKTVAELVDQIEEIDDAFPSPEVVDENSSLLSNGERERQESVLSDLTGLIGSRSGAKHLERENRKNQISGVWGAMHGKTLRQQLLSPWFILMMLFTVIQMTRTNYFVATIRPQYEYLLHSHEKAVKINTFFDIALPLGGMLSIPFVGLVLDNTSTLTVLWALVSIATAVGILGCLTSTWAAYANVSLFVLCRPFYYTTVSDYVAKVFGFRTFGTVYGTIICLAGLFNFSQRGFDALLHKVFHGNPVPLNVILLVTCFVFGASLCIFIAAKAYQIRRDRLEYEAEDATEIMMPGALSPERLS
jgi:MFS family permease